MHWDLVEADFQRYYGLDLRSEVHRVGIRRLTALVDGLPPDAALSRRGSMWTQSHEIAALQVEKAEARLAALAVMWADDKSKGKIPPPVVLTHPDRPRPVKAKKKVSPSGVAALFGAK